MASTQKKTGGRKTSSAPGKKPSARAKKPAQPAKRPIRREVCGGVLLLLMLCTAVSSFGVNGIFNDWLAGLLKGLFGYGYYLAAPAMAEEDELAPGFDRCMEQSGGVTTEMLGCLQQAYEYWDVRLNANYKKARQACKSSSDPKGCSDKLLKGQRAWVQYKEAFTDLVQLPNEGGSMARLNSMSFLTGETRKQALLLGQIAGE